ncbi:DUF536 domain-containing protein [Lactiplantibacillus pentosus]|uniref:DUF536 domain-containing protein n=1 Tax=Lactiplantibacillus pentosus TaxID=1589 RepID=A0AAW8WJT2_LACPE|nr:DUF536 domain-containing protein [Lactiplantibacillus pentosus]MBU7553716.1 DUF536 domain-containing protein [Lactiplantibacillus pentosus]MDT7040645.1 DUF536 domain-containing protein [Lactiplantibacillus pentosus]MDT7040655.1 DUF536 domain-containing protein [Lactiplantibacillus pentosus]
MPKTIKELADELKVSKQAIQYHYQRLPAKNRQKNNQGANMISLTAERIIRDKVVKSLSKKGKKIPNKEVAKTSKENKWIITDLKREITEIKKERDKRLATKDQQISNKDQQIDHLTKLIDQQQQLQLTTVAENRELKARIQKISGLLETSKSSPKRQKNVQKEGVYNNKSNKNWWHFW